MTTRPNTRSTGPPEAPQLTQEQLNELNVHREVRQLLNNSLPISQRQTSPVPNPRVDHTYRRQVSLPPSSEISLQHFMDSSDQQVTTNASLVVEQVNLIGSPQLDYRLNTSIGTPNEQTERLHLTHFFSQPSSPQRPYRYARSNWQFGPQPTSSMENHEDTLQQLQMLQHSQRAIQSQINSLTQQTTTAGWYNSQLATELPSGRSNSAVRTVATTPGLPWEPEMIADQAAYICTILWAKNILPTTRASSSNQLFNVSHPPENLEIHPLDPPKSQIPTFQQAHVLAMPVPSEQPTHPNPVFTAYRRDFCSQAPTGPYLSVPPCSVCGYTRHDRYECPYLAFGFNAPRLPITVTQVRTVSVVPTTTVVQPRTISVVSYTTVVPAHIVPVVPTPTVARKAVTLPVYKEGKCSTTHIHRFVNALALNGKTDELIKIALFGNSLIDANNYNWFTTQRTTYPYQDFQELLTTFKLHYQEVDNDDQAYLKFRSLKQEDKESVDDYYETMMKLANQFATIPSDNFLMSNFRAGLLKYLQVAIVGLPRTTLVQARKSAKTAESSLPKDEVPSTSTPKPDRPPVKKCTLCGKHHHEAKDCWLNPESKIGKWQAAQRKTTTVAVTTPTTTPTEPRKYPPKGEPRHIHPCSICQEEHLTYQCLLLKDPTVCAYLK